jgi:delta8-fatty-acid desaturase
MSVANLLGGLSIGWWKRSHNVHHVFTNHPEHDPDIQHLPFFAISEMFFDNLYSTYYGRIMAFDLASKWLISFQHLTFYIILAFGRFYLYVQSIQYYMLHSATSSIVRHEMVLNVLYWVWYLALLSHVPTWPLRIAFVLVSHLSTALLHIQITLSHYSRDVDRIPIHESFASMTFRTTLDVDCLSQLDWLHGGLQVDACLIHMF